MAAIDIVKHVQNSFADFAEAHPRTNIAQSKGITACAEFERIDSLPRRVWDDAAAAELAAKLTAILRTPGGTQSLRPIQAIALYEIAAYGGLIGPIRVGAGKTLVTLLAPSVLGSYRPLLLLPAKLIPKTKKDMLAAAMHWRIAAHMTIVSYEWLGRHQAANYLNETKPDCVICDEAHYIRNTRASRTKRITHYTGRQFPAFIPLSGTLIRKSMRDWAHLGTAALGKSAPVPKTYQKQTHWGNALDLGGKLSPGVLARWCEGNETVREGYRRRIVETPGVVSTTEGLLGVALNGEAWHTDLPPVLNDALAELKETWTLPDGMLVTDPLDYYRKARQMALGVFYRWKYEPPPEWRARRKAWGQFVRHASRYLKDPTTGRTYDSEKMVALGCVNDRLDRADYDAWRAIRDTFIPEIEHIWVTDVIAKRLIEAAQPARDTSPAIVWVETKAVGLLMHALGFPYYGAKGLTPEKKSILDAAPGDSFAASIDSAGTGLNLQAWCRNLITAPIPDAQKWEQLLGRTHRDGQEADEVTVQVAYYHDIHHRSWAKARAHARFIHEITGQEQKLLTMTLVDLEDE